MHPFFRLLCVPCSTSVCLLGEIIPLLTSVPGSSNKITEWTSTDTVLPNPAINYWPTTSTTTTIHRTNIPPPTTMFHPAKFVYDAPVIDMDMFAHSNGHGLSTVPPIPAPASNFTPLFDRKAPITRDIYGDDSRLHRRARLNYSNDAIPYSSTFRSNTASPEGQNGLYVVPRYPQLHSPSPIVTVHRGQGDNYTPENDPLDSAWHSRDPHRRGSLGRQLALFDLLTAHL